MTWIVLLTLLLIVIGVIMVNQTPVRWINQMRHQPGRNAPRYEWNAPEDVVLSVKEHYLAATNWISDSILLDWALQWSSAPHYLSGLYLKRYQEILKQYSIGQSPRYLGILRCAHQIEVRHFSANGGRCLVIDWQTSRRMATYEFWTQRRQGTQDLGDGVVVYEMNYDKQTQRWKIHRFIQELPLSWQVTPPGENWQSHLKLPQSLGRDN